MVLSYYGLDISDYSFAYVSSWSGSDTKKIAASADRIHHAASSIIAAMEQADASNAHRRPTPFGSRRRWMTRRDLRAVNDDRL